jgi:hypothetical protein
VPDSAGRGHGRCWSATAFPYQILFTTFSLRLPSRVTRSRPAASRVIAAKSQTYPCVGNWLAVLWLCLRQSIPVATHPTSRTAKNCVTPQGDEMPVTPRTNQFVTQLRWWCPRRSLPRRWSVAMQTTKSHDQPSKLVVSGISHVHVAATLR